MSYTVESHWNYGPDEDYNTGRGLAAAKDTYEQAFDLFQRLQEPGYSVDLIDNRSGLVMLHWGPPTDTAIRSMRKAYSRCYGKGGPVPNRPVSEIDVLVRRTADDLTWLLNHGYAISRRDPNLLDAIDPGLGQRARSIDAAYMVFDPTDDAQGYLLIDDDLPALLREARRHLDD